MRARSLHAAPAALIAGGGSSGLRVPAVVAASRAVQPGSGAAAKAAVRCAACARPAAGAAPLSLRSPLLQPWWGSPRRSVAAASTPSPTGVAWLSSIEFGPGFGAGNGSASGANGGGLGAALAALQRERLDAVVMLAGGLTPDGGMPEWVSRRLDTAYDVHQLQQRRPPILMLGGGTPHKPPVLDPSSGHVIHESTACATYLMGKGAEEGALLKEVSSYDTVGNAYFALTIHAIPANWRRVAVVTSAFHMPRSKALFDSIWRLAGESVYGDPNRFELVYVSASDEGVFDDYVYQARLEKEAQAVANWKKAAASFSCLADFHAWFYADHLCYAVPKQHLFGVRTIKDERLLASY